MVFGSFAFKPVARQTIVVEAHGLEKLLTSWQPESKERKKKRVGSQ
jgi:hypothetical protein